MKVHAAVFAFAFLFHNSVFASMSAENDIHELVKKCTAGINADTKVAVGIVKTESAGNPFSIGINSKNVRLKRQPQNIIEAVEVATWLAENRYNFDAGIAQINSVNIEKLISGDINFRMRKIFDPCENLQLAKIIYNSCFQMTGSTVGALSCYNTGDAKKGVKNGYVAKVLANIPVLLDVKGGVGTKPTVPLVSKQRRAESDLVDNSSEVNEEKKPEKKDSENEDIFAASGEKDVFEK